jgi:DNA-binding NarL/FixJ family response regulator
MGPGACSITSRVLRTSAVTRNGPRLAEESGLLLVSGAALHMLALLAFAARQFDAAADFAGRALRLLRERDGGPWLAYALNDIGFGFSRAGDPARGVPLIEEGLALSYAVGNRYGAGIMLADLGVLAHDVGDLSRAAGRFREAVKLLADIGDTWYLASPLSGLASIAALTGEMELAATLLGAVDELRQRSGAHAFPTEGQRSAQAEMRVRAALGDDVFARAYAAGRAMSLPQAVAAAVTINGDAPDAINALKPGAGSRYGLTPRELEVLQLVVGGQSDREIADALVISRRTAEGHVASILGKLDVRTRAAAVATAVSAGLVSGDSATPT